MNKIIIYITLIISLLLIIYYKLKDDKEGFIGYVNQYYYRNKRTLRNKGYDFLNPYWKKIKSIHKKNKLISFFSLIYKCLVK